MTLSPLYQMVIKKVGKDAHITPADVLAVAWQESDFIGTFSPNENLYRANMAAAASCTTLPQALLLDALIIKDGPNKGLIAKFRFEPSYWTWARTQGLPSPTDMFLCSCSFGIGQQMMKWVLPTNKKLWPVFIENFKANLDTQTSHLIMNLRTLMVSNNGNLFKAYSAYNSGNPDSKDPAVVRRAQNVLLLRDIVAKQLRG